MADFLLADLTNAGLGAVTLGLSTDVTAVTQGPTIFPLSVEPIAFEGASASPRQPVVSVVHRAIGGAIEELFAGRLFERIIVTPRTKALGFVLSSTQFPIEVWNTFRNVLQVLTSIVINGSGGVTLSDPFGEPLIYGPLDSFIYQATMPASGPAQINQDIVFVFLSGIGGTDTLITGSRITMFSVQPDWSEGLVEKISFLTDVLRSYSDNEQRRAVRQFARRGMRYRATALTARNAAGMESLIWGWQHQPFGVPWWPDQTPLTSTIGAGSFVIPCVTTDRLFAPGGIAVILVDEFNFEALTVDEVFADHITVTSPTQFNWTANPATLVMPVFLARLPDSVKVDRLFSGADSVDCEFAGEASQPAPAPTISPATYKGFDVLEQAPNWEQDLGRTYDRSIAHLDPLSGPITVVDRGGNPVIAQEFPWWLDGHANVTAFRAFLIRRKGRKTPFWIPTWDQDLVLVNDVGPTDTGITIESEFYTRFFFPNKARRYIAFIPTDGSGNVYAKITGSADNGDGTELLTLETATGKLFPRAQTQVSFLTLARLDSDDAEIEWFNSDQAQSTLQLREVPKEVP
jgi:hypothetical protein